jgi:hypothetical protein
MDLTQKGNRCFNRLDHFALIRAGGQHALETSEPMLQNMKPRLELLSWALATLYEVGTCDRNVAAGRTRWNP